MESNNNKDNFNDNFIDGTKNFDENFEESPASQVNNPILFYDLLEEKKYSTYNCNYYCQILSVEINNDLKVIKVKIDMHGDMSLGTCQNPKSSKLYIGNKELRVTDTDFERTSFEYGYTGDLIYPYNGETGKVIFSFGEFSYSSPEILEIN